MVLPVILMYGCIDFVLEPSKNLNLIFLKMDFPIDKMALSLSLFFIRFQHHFECEYNHNSFLTNFLIATHCLEDITFALNYKPVLF